MSYYLKQVSLKPLLVMTTFETTIIRLFFTIKNIVLVPLRGQNARLDKVFAENVVELTKNYNKYTKNFINNHKKDGKIYMSTQYEYVADGCLFNFSKLVVAKDEELKGIYNTNIDDTKDVSNTNENIKCSFTENVISTFECPSIEKDGFYVDAFNWKYLTRNIARKKNTLMIGETGTGKTELVMLAAKKMGIECNVYDMGTMQDPLTDLLGSHRLNGGNSEFDYAKFVEYIQKPGIIVLDELSLAH